MGRIVQDGKTYLRISEVCEITDRSRSRVRELVKEGKLRTAALSGSRARVFPLKDVVDYLAARRMMQGLNPDDIALTLVRMERRLRRLEATVGKKGPFASDPRSDARVTAELLADNLDSLKSYIGIR